MEIKEFGQVIARELKDLLGDGYSIEYRDVVKNNGIVYHAVVIRKDGENVAPTIYIDKYYEEYTKGSLIMGIVKDIADIYRQCIPSCSFDLDFYFDFSKVSQKLFFKVLSYRKNREKLKNVPIKRIMDLALVPMCIYKNRMLGEGTIMIQDSHLETWEITREELWENVALSAPKVAPPKISSLMDFLSRVTGENTSVDELCGIYVVTNTSENLGAGTIFYPGLLKGIADDHECDLYIIPSSIHECIVIPDDGYSMDTSFLRNIIREVNSSTVADVEILSDNLYRYDRDEDRLSIVKG